MNANIDQQHESDQTVNYSIRQLALACFLECDPAQLTENRFDKTRFDHGNRSYRVLTDEEADEASQEYIRNWAEQRISEVSDSFRDYIDLDRYVEDHWCSGERVADLNHYDGTEGEIDTDTDEFREWVYLTFRIDQSVELDDVRLSDADLGGDGIFYIY